MTRMLIIPAGNDMLILWRMENPGKVLSMKGIIQIVIDLVQEERWIPPTWYYSKLSSGNFKDKPMSSGCQKLRCNHARVEAKEAFLSAD